jgi:hypothetical protein
MDEVEVLTENLRELKCTLAKQKGAPNWQQWAGTGQSLGQQDIKCEVGMGRHLNTHRLGWEQ